MSKGYIVAIDQSTSGTKALLLDEKGNIIERSDLPHEQIVNQSGWVEHNPIEIYNNTLMVVRDVIEKSGIDKGQIRGLGISNQRETAMMWHRITGEPIYNAIVWQCARGEGICKEIAKAGYSTLVKEHTGLDLSPYFSAAKLGWMMKNVVPELDVEVHNLYAGTMDSWLVYKLTEGKCFKTDYSNASRTQLFNIIKLEWDQEICALFNLDRSMLAEVCDANAWFGETDFGGYLDQPIPIQGVMGDSHGALFGQGCVEKGMIKATYGTGSSIMMNIGESPVLSQRGVVTSLAWRMGGQVNYVLEGNINYAGAVLKWVQDDLKLIDSPAESEDYAFKANPNDQTYLVPAFSGLGAPYWASEATAMFVGMTRTTKKAEIIKAAVECIAYQITDIVRIMSEESGVTIQELRVDGGPTRNNYLMQFQSDLLDSVVQVPQAEELSAIGAAYAAGIKLGLYNKEQLFAGMKRTQFTPEMSHQKREEKYKGWQQAVKRGIKHDL